MGWTVEHSHSGFNAPRHHLLAYRTPERPALYGEVRGNLITAHGILDEVLAGEIDVGPLDAYWHDLIRAYRPDLTDGIRVIGSTDLAPIPSVDRTRPAGRDRRAPEGRLRRQPPPALVRAPGRDVAPRRLRAGRACRFRTERWPGTGKPGSKATR